MAVRPVFISVVEKPYVKTEMIEFKYYSGFAISQSRKSIDSLHESFVSQNPEYCGLVLEVSSKSINPLGVRLSAFNLLYMLSDGKKRFVENVFQSSKCFANGEQYLQLLDMTPTEAKHFPELRTSGDVVKFRLEGIDFPTEPKTYFYDWLYIHALYQNKELTDAILGYRVFTDIAFNPEKSINCQARSVALFVALHETGKLTDAIESPESFRKIAYPIADSEKKRVEIEQMSMF